MAAPVTLFDVAGDVPVIGVRMRHRSSAVGVDRGELHICRRGRFYLGPSTAPEDGIKCLSACPTAVEPFSTSDFKVLI